MSRSQLGPKITAPTKIEYYAGSPDIVNLLREVEMTPGLSFNVVKSPSLGPVLQLQQINYLPMSFRTDLTPNDRENIGLSRTESTGITEATPAVVPAGDSRNNEDRSANADDPGEQAWRKDRAIQAAKARARNTVRMIQAALTRASQASKKLKFAPDLVMWINPTDFSISYSKIKSNTMIRGDDQSRYARHYYGDAIASISFSGRTPAFFTRETGLTGAFRSHAASWHHLMALVAVYRVNGCMLEDDKQRYKSVGDVIISYDSRSYAGSFRSFSISDTADFPFVVEYSATFMVRREWR